MATDEHREVPRSDLSRRAFLHRALALGAVTATACGAALAHPGRLLGRTNCARPNGSRTSRGTYDDDEPSEAVKKVLRELFGDRPIRKGHVELTMPADPPDGGLVPVFMESDLPMEPGDHVVALHLLVDKNPDIHLAEFRFTPAMGKASIDTRIKMRATSWVRAIAETSQGEIWYQSAKVFPGSNGCG